MAGLTGAAGIIEGISNNPVVGIVKPVAMAFIISRAFGFGDHRRQRPCLFARHRGGD